jgi:hypothetical protein
MGQATHAGRDQVEDEVFGVRQVGGIVSEQRVEAVCSCRFRREAQRRVYPVDAGSESPEADVVDEHRQRQRVAAVRLCHLPQHAV